MSEFFLKGRVTQAGVRHRALRRNETPTQGVKGLAGALKRVHVEDQMARKGLAVDATGRDGQESPNGINAMVNVHEMVAIARSCVHDRSADAEVRVIVARRMRTEGPTPRSGRRIGVRVGETRTTVATVKMASKIGCMWMKGALTSLQ